MSKLKIYEYENCSTCKKALKFLRERGVDFEQRPIVEHPPDLKSLKTMLAHLDGDIKRLFNTSGQVYRELKLSDKMKTMSEAEALRLLAGNGKLIKRPFVLGLNVGVVGFKELEWERIFLNLDTLK